MHQQLNCLYAYFLLALEFYLTVLLLCEHPKRTGKNIMIFYHSHKKRQDSLETRAVLLIFSLELKISGVAVQRIHQNS